MKLLLQKIMVAKSCLVQLFSIVALLALSACNQAKPYTGFTSAFVWESDQIRISADDGTLNVWTGFVVETGIFRASKQESSLTLWRRTPLQNALLKINYQLSGRRAVFSLPGPKARRLALAPSTNFHYRINLRSGLNILTFRTKPGSQLKIREVTIGDAIDRKHLESGDSLLLYPPPGAGEVALTGKGRIEIKTILFAKVEEKRTMGKVKTGLFSSTLRIPFSFIGRGCLKLTVISGQFMVTAYSSRPATRTAIRSSRFAAKPDVFIFLLDACQASHLGIYGYQRPTSPHIDRLVGSLAGIE